jgi:hypothetical protein
MGSLGSAKSLLSVAEDMSHPRSGQKHAEVALSIKIHHAKATQGYFSRLESEKDLRSIYQHVSMVAAGESQSSAEACGQVWSQPVVI